MSKYDGAELEIINWEKYNPRKDLKATSWFRFQNSIFEDPNFIDFDHGEIVALIYLLTLASKKQRGEVKLNFAHAERIGRLSAEQLESAIEKLQSIQFVRITSKVEHVDVTRTSRGRHTHVPLRDETNVTRRNETNVTNETTHENEISCEQSEVGKSEIEEAGKGDNPVREFIGLYCELWKSRYKTNPEMSGKPAGIAKRLVKNLGIRRARELVYAYLEMNDIWFIQQRHDLTTLESKLSAVVIYADTGATVTQGELRQADKTQTNRNVWDSLKAPVGGSHGK